MPRTAGTVARRSTRRLVAACLAAGALALTAAGAAPAVADDPPAPFTFVVVPDTQGYTKSVTNHPIMGQQMQWILDTRAQLGTAFVSSLGDIVEFESNTTNWQRASDYWGMLDTAGVPTSVVPGNHDMDMSNGALIRYGQYFPVSRYAGAAWTPPTASYGGYLGQNQFGPDAIDRQNADSYSLFSAGGMDFLVLSLEYAPPDAAVDWARRVLAAYPDRRAILVTHSFLDLTGQRSAQVIRADGGNSGQELWDNLVSTSCSIFLVVSGHFHAGDLGEARRTDDNACGTPVHQVVSDYQERANGGNGWLRYYTFDPAADEIRAFTYSPSLGASETDADSQFVLPYDMTGTGPMGPPTLAKDQFGRTTTSGWGSSEIGGPWTHAGAASRYTVTDGTGRQATPPGSTLTSTLGTLGSTATDLHATVALDRVPDVTAYLTFTGRLVGSQDYSARIKVAPTGALQLQLFRAGVALSGAVSPGFALSGGMRVHVRVQAEGTAPTALRARVWRDGTVEPTTWQAVATDATGGLQAPGGIRLSTYASGTTTGGALVSSFDDVLVTQVGTTPPPVNQPPQASFVATPSGLSVAVDSAASSDPDGTIVSRAWTFGDGATAGTTAATHTYASAGDYTVGLTVTDDDGATASTTRQVTVAEPSSALAADAFGRTVASGWGTADVGGAWTVNSAARFSVGSGVGRIQVPSGSTLTGALPGVASTATDLHTTVTYAAQPDVTAYLYVTGRLVGSTDYSARLKLLASGSTQLSLLSGSTVLTTTTLPAGTFGPGLTLHVRLQVQGTSPTALRVRVWRDGTTEPAGWTSTASDSLAALQAPGAVRVSAYLSSGATTGPLALAYDDVKAVGLG
ncbi:PKD domain-containing protein [Cellulomonas edaphi]|uniref:PKD domain-containing protein n=1 Tax=Cellulomonas edaphi TaxID=3053468 RepID=A0ABT7S933_9CELL|nr:PKD domain-containing protein [Cellulomons edaphi]MDM7832105.1 PKD domain-containing protein [Cellulomons edaphi]